MTDANVHELPDGAPDADGLTARQRMILDCITEAIASRGYPPSMREIGKELGLKRAENFGLRALIRKGYLERMGKHTPRSLRLPIHGKVPARSLCSSCSSTSTKHPIMKSRSLSTFFKPRARSVLMAMRRQS